MIPRKVAIPWIIAVTAANLLTSAVSLVSLSLEFHNSKWIVEDHPPLPPLTALLESIYPFVWLLPLFNIAYGAALLRHSKISSVHLSWFLSSSLFILFAWFLLVAIAFYCVYSMGG